MATPYYRCGLASFGYNSRIQGGVCGMCPDLLTISERHHYGVHRMPSQPSQAVHHLLKLSMYLYEY